MERSVKKWPPAVAGVAALVLALFVLPNPFKIPQNNPTASAEYAPVPGKTDDVNNANFGQTGLADSAGIGSGNDGEGLGAGTPPPPPPPQFRPRQKNCIGNPPRQTEDPLSPPCVPFFEGNNGGATFQGVTKDEIKIVLYNDRCCDGDMTKPWKSSDEKTCAFAFECEYIYRTVKAYVRYFQKRYQTYGRTVKVYAAKSTGNVGAECPSRRGDAQRDYQKYKPFAIVNQSSGNHACYMDEMRKRGVASLGDEWLITQKEYSAKAPYVWGFLPDDQTKAEWSAAFICKKLKGYDAKFTRDTNLRGKTRTWGFIRPGAPSRGPELMQAADLLTEELDKQCDFKFDVIRKFGQNGGADEAGPIMQAMKTDNITTIVCYCIPVNNENTTPAMEKAATGIVYYPEWYHDSSERNDQPAWIQLLGERTQQRFGATMWWRNEAYKEQPHYKAYQSEEPNTQPNTRFGVDYYLVFLNLFSGIQGAGPQLTPQSIERGMFTFNYMSQKNPYVPTGGYGPYNKNAVSDYTFLDTAMGWWWDPTGTPPGGKSGEGCLRVAQGGRRFYATQWTAGDADLGLETDPCSEDLREIEDVGTAF